MKQPSPPYPRGLDCNNTYSYLGSPVFFAPHVDPETKQRAVLVLCYIDGKEYQIPPYMYRDLVLEKSWYDNETNDA
jgi:hypothetical protein